MFGIYTTFSGFIVGMGVWDQRLHVFVGLRSACDGLSWGRAEHQEQQQEEEWLAIPAMTMSCPGPTTPILLIQNIIN